MAGLNSWELDIAFGQTIFTRINFWLTPRPNLCKSFTDLVYLSADLSLLLTGRRSLFILAWQEYKHLSPFPLPAPLFVFSLTS